MTCLADVYGFKICIEDCVLLAFRPLYIDSGQKIKSAF